MKTTEKGINLIKEFEGVKLTAYLCPAGVWTIGYGHTANVKKGNKIDIVQADIFLAEDIVPIEKFLNAKKLNINQNQFDALVSFIFNLGTGAFFGSTLYRKIVINPKDKTISDEFMKWTKAKVNGVLTTLPGLVKRRAAEAKLYFSNS